MSCPGAWVMFVSSLIELTFAKNTTVHPQCTVPLQTVTHTTHTGDPLHMLQHTTHSPHDYEYNKQLARPGGGRSLQVSGINRERERVKCIPYPLRGRAEDTRGERRRLRAMIATLRLADGGQ